MDIVEPQKAPIKVNNSTDGDLIGLIDNPIQQSQPTYIPPVNNYQTSINQSLNTNVPQESIFATASQSGVFNFFDNTKPQLPQYNNIVIPVV